MRKIILFALVLLLPGSAAAQTMGLYFEWEQPVMHYRPLDEGIVFDMYLFLRGSQCYVTAVEYRLTTPDDPDHVLFTVVGVQYPDNMSLIMGHPFSGHQIAFWPPLTGSDEYCHVCTIRAVMLPPPVGVLCETYDFPLVIGPDPASGHIRASSYPNNDLFNIVGLTSILNPKKVSTQDNSWSAIKRMTIE